MQRETEQIRKTIAMLSAMIDNPFKKHDNVSKVMIKAALENLDKIKNNDRKLKIALEKITPKENSGCIYKRKLHKVYNSIVEDNKVLIQEVETAKIKDVYPFELKFRNKNA